MSLNTTPAEKVKSHYARVTHSPRLQRLLMLLSNGKEYTTMQIILGANVAAVNSAVHELRCNDIPVNCRRLRDGDSMVFAYSLVF
jgi:hypothetical protein